MSDNIFVFPGAQRPVDSVNPEPNKELIHLLGILVEHAKSGKLQNFIGCGFTAQNERMALWVNTHPDVYSMLGSIAWLEHEYVYRVTQKPP